MTFVRSVGTAVDIEYVVPSYTLQFEAVFQFEDEVPCQTTSPFAGADAVLMVFNVTADKVLV